MSVSELVGEFRDLLASVWRGSDLGGEGLGWAVDERDAMLSGLPRGGR